MISNVCGFINSQVDVTFTVDGFLPLPYYYYYKKFILMRNNSQKDRRLCDQVCSFSRVAMVLNR